MGIIFKKWTIPYITWKYLLSLINIIFRGLLAFRIWWLWGETYLIFVILFTPTHFEAWKLYTQKCVNLRQNTTNLAQNSPFQLLSEYFTPARNVLHLRCMWHRWQISGMRIVCTKCFYCVSQPERSLGWRDKGRCAPFLQSLWHRARKNSLFSNYFKCVERNRTVNRWTIVRKETHIFFLRKIHHRVLFRFLPLFRHSSLLWAGLGVAPSDGNQPGWESRLK